MTTVNIAFSGGVESTYLLQLALEKGFDVNLCIINVGGVPEFRLAELITMERIIKFYTNEMTEQKDYLPKAKQTLTGRIVDTMHMAGCPFFARQTPERSLVSTGVTQQFGVVLGMLAIRREYVDNFMPSTWIGWTKDDCAERTFNELDHSEKDYQALLNLPELIGPLSNADNIGIKFRAPLWEMTKAEVYAKLMDGAKELIIPNGHSHRNWSNGTVCHVVHQDKQKEWEAAGIPCQREYHFHIATASWVARFITGDLLPADVGQPDTRECRELLQLVAPFFAKGRALIRPGEADKIRQEVTGRVADLITTAAVIFGASLAKKETISEGEDA